MNFNLGGYNDRNDKKTKILVVVLLVAIIVLTIVGLVLKIVDANGGKESQNIANKVEKSQGAINSKTKGIPEDDDKIFTITNSEVAPGIKITSQNGEFNPNDSNGFAGLSVQIAYDSATTENKISYEIYSSSGIVDGYAEGGLSEDTIQKATDLIDRTEFCKADAFPADILYWFPMADEKDALLTVRVKNMAAQSEFLRFGIEIQKNKSGAYEIVGIKNVEIKGASNMQIAELAYSNLSQIYKDIVPSKTCKVSKIGKISNTMAVYVKPNESLGMVTDLTGQIGVTFNFIEGINLNPITVYLDSETLEYLGYDKYDQVFAF